jgi:lipopolysaccharide/colanic/teichoic acid biosynthesis glycosyltransferase
MQHDWVFVLWENNDIAISKQQRLIKRSLDIIVSLVLIGLTSPLMIITGCTIWLIDGGPVLFRQQRIGERGRVFTMVKFRTMISGAETMTIKGSLHQGNSISFYKTADDPRVTPLGKWLRRTSLDELPQLFNVLLGDMSLVGPRPELPWIVAQYEPWQYRRLAVPQGLTGLWQVTGRSRNPMYQFTHLDIQYIQDYSLWLDIAILLRTPLIVYKGDGAF